MKAPKFSGLFTKSKYLERNSASATYISEMRHTIGAYFNEKFKIYNFLLEHNRARDFYVCCWQSNRDVLPLLCIRLVLFLTCVAILLASIIMTAQDGVVKFWATVLSNWGLLFITMTTGAAFAVSSVAYFKGHIRAEFRLPWYVKTYWALYNISVTLAFFITIYYYTFVTYSPVDFAIDPTLDCIIHSVNSIIMFVMLMTSRHPCNVLHFYNVLLVTVVYVIFSIIYYAAGGTDPYGNNFIYPMLDWSTPFTTFGLVILNMLAQFVIYLSTVALSGLRDFISDSSHSCHNRTEQATVEYTNHYE